MVFTIDKENKVATSILKIKTAVDNMYVIASGINPDQKIIVSGVGKLKNGMTISPQEISFDEAIKPIATLFKN